MRSKNPFRKSERTFQVWEYQISHGQLLIRSPKAPAGNAWPELFTNIDIICLDVEYMALPRVLRGVEILPATKDEIAGLESLLGETVDPDSVRILASGGKRFPIVAASLDVDENDWGIFDSPSQFHSISSVLNHSLSGG